MPAGLTTLGIPGAESPSETDKRLYTAWKNAVGMAKDRALSALLDNLSGAIMTAVNSFSGAPLPSSTMKLEAYRYAKEGLEAYNPTLTPNLASYIVNHVKQKLYRYVGTYQNAARIPEYQIQKIAPLRTAMSELTQRNGYEPTTAQLADHLSMPVNRIVALRRLLRRDLLEEGGGVESIEVYEHDPAFEKAMLAYYSMNDVEKLVFDYSLGAHGQKALSNNEIATKLKLSAGRVSQLKRKIADKIKPYLDGGL